MLQPTLQSVTDLNPTTWMLPAGQSAFQHFIEWTAWMWFINFWKCNWLPISPTLGKHCFPMRNMVCRMHRPFCHHHDQLEHISFTACHSLTTVNLPEVQRLLCVLSQPSLVDMGHPLEEPKNGCVLEPVHGSQNEPGMCNQCIHVTHEGVGMIFSRHCWKTSCLVGSVMDMDLGYNIKWTALFLPRIV